MRNFAIFVLILIKSGFVLAQNEYGFDLEAIKRENISKAAITHKEKDTTYLSAVIYFSKGLIIRDSGNLDIINHNFYNRENLFIKQISYTFDKMTGDSILFYKLENQFKGKWLNLTTQIFYDSLGKVESSNKTIFDYNDTLISKQTWINHNDTTYSFCNYDNLGRKVMSFGKNYSKNKERSEFQYDSDNRLVKEIYYSPKEIGYQTKIYEYVDSKLTKIIYYPNRFSNMDYSKNPDRKDIVVHKIDYFENGLIKRWTCTNDFGDNVLWINKYKYDK